MPKRAPKEVEIVKEEELKFGDEEPEKEEDTLSLEGFEEDDDDADGNVEQGASEEGSWADD